MANLSITNVCNRKCPYCFANDTRDEYGDAHMDEQVYDQALDYIMRSGLEQVRLLGGEPTLHPKFCDFVEKGLKRGLEIMLFTNGMMTDGILEFLATIPEERLLILLNTIHPDEKDRPGIKRQQKVMEVLGKRIVPGVNIYSASQDFQYLLEYVLTYGLHKEIRLGISHPVLSKNNRYLHPKAYNEIGSKIARFKTDAKQAGISLGFDCGFVPCMFPEESLDLLSEELEKAGNACHPIIDMLSDGTFISCYPLNNLSKVKINDQSNADELTSHFNRVLKPYQDVGIYPFCSSCPLFGNRCNGGCMAYRIKRYETAEG